MHGDLRVLIGILAAKLTLNDTRWAALGLNAPGAAVTPKTPTHLASHPALAGWIHATCAVQPGADNLRWFLTKPGQMTNVTDTANGKLLLTRQTGDRRWSFTRRR